MSKKVDFLTKLALEFEYIKSSLLNKLDQDQKQEYESLEKIYQSINQQFQTSLVDQRNLAEQIYGSFLKTVKKFKRRQENILKFNERDVDAFRKKWEQQGYQLLPLIHDIKMNVNERFGQFDIEKLKDQNFQMHLYTNRELCDIALKMFEHQGFYTTTQISAQQLGGLIQEMCLTYNVVPYHNWSHAFSLFQMLFCCYYQSDLKNFLQPFDMFSAMFASLAHDINHKGVNNLYKMKKRSQKALIYSDLAILENMHCSTFFSLLQSKPELDITKNIGDTTAVVNFKRLIISSILATDMGRHNKFVSKLKQRGLNTNNFRTNGDNSTDLDKFFNLKKEVFEDRRFICNILVHACDIGNPCLEFNNYMNWSFMVSQEFFDQTIKEEKNGLEVTMMLKYKDKLTFYGGQQFFSKVLVLPLWKEIGQIFPELQQYPNQIEKNLERLEEEKKKLQGQL